MLENDTEVYNSWRWVEKLMRLRQRKTEKINEEEEMDLRKMFLFVCLLYFQMTARLV